MYLWLSTQSQLLFYKCSYIMHIQGFTIALYRLWNQEGSLNEVLERNNKLSKETETTQKTARPVDALDLEHIYIPITVSNLVVSHWFYTFYTRFYLVLVSAAFSDYFRF